MSEGWLGYKYLSQDSGLQTPEGITLIPSGAPTLSNMPFRFQAKYGLLTYAQCGDLDPFAVVTRLSELGAECIVGREIHEDGGIHLHAFFSFEKKRNLKNERIFDVEGVHPNIQASYGTPEKGYDYAIKDGDVVGGGLERPSGEDTTDKPIS